MSTTIHKQIFYRGRVQGVGFRYSVKQIAAGYDVVGWVRNLPDGRVELQVSGDPTEIQAFEAAIASSHLADHIQGKDENSINLQSHHGVGFEIRH